MAEQPEYKPAPEHKPGDWEMVRHTVRHDYPDHGPDAYTLRPQGAIITGISEDDARLIEAAPKLQAENAALREALGATLAFDLESIDPANGKGLRDKARAALAAGPSFPSRQEAPAEGITGGRIHETLAARHEIAVIWAVEDVQEVRPDLDAAQSWEVLKAVKHDHDCNEGINWDMLEIQGG
jgi:hypothetical protein